MGCELCKLAVEPIWRNDKLAIIMVDDPAYPGFCRVIWKDHVKEMSDLSVSDRSLLVETVNQVEMAVREVMAPAKMNVASLGNMVPHLHWHVIPRFTDDAHFPAPVWAQAVRSTDEAVLAARRAQLPQLSADIQRRMEFV